MIDGATIRRGFLLILALAAVSCGGERDGTVKYDDCREIIQLKGRSAFATIGKDFTCSISRTKSGKSMGGQCVSVALSLLDGKCERAYVYEKKPANVCWPNSHLTYEDMCQCDDGYSWELDKQGQQVKPSRCTKIPQTDLNP